MASVETLQDRFLEEVRRNRTQVTVFLMNGFQIRGTVQGYDNFVLVLAPNANRICLQACHLHNHPLRAP